ncbi:MAG: DUF4493 domain-containing protein, partial [Muribaculaceae bacterium]|nr:DUF4493 domain-containing protein [Muribaculaceae bacterium]
HMFSGRYTYDFKGRFAAYSAALKSESSADYVIFAQNEDRPAYMKPEKISLRLTLTNTQGQEVKVSPYSFVAQPRHHYIVTMGVKDDQGTGDIRLDVQITEEVQSEFIDISLGEELFSAPKPSVKAVDFPDSMRYEDFEGFSVQNDPRVDVLAYAGLMKVNLNVSSANTLIFGNSVELVGADQLTQANVESTGLVVEGLFRNPDKAGVIKFKKFLSKLPVGTYKFSIEAQDARTVMCDKPVEFNVTIKPVTIGLAVAQHTDYMGEQMTVTVTANKQDVKDNIRFEVTDANEQWTAAEIIADPAAIRTRADQQYAYDFKLSIPAAQHKEVKVRAFYGSELEPKAEITDEGVIFPEYKVAVDAFAQKALIKVTPTDPTKLKVIMDNFKVLLNGAERTLSEYNAAAGVYEMTGLDPDKDYDAIETFLSYASNPHVKSDPFKTEAANDVNNGEFENVTQTLNFTGVNVGGKFKTTALAIHQNTTSIVRSTPDGWANVNDLTCWNGASNKNTWFIVPSTFSDNGAVVIRSVGYSHNGTDPAQTGTNADTHYYCQNSPADNQLSKAAGELFLGSYSFDGSEHRTDGISWATRPESLSFTYSYVPYNNEKGEAYVRIYDASGTLLSSGSAVLQSNQNASVKIPLVKYPFGKKAAKIELGFRSTSKGVTPAVNIPQGDALNESKNGVSYNNYHTNTNSYNAVALGSELVVDNVKLGYEPASTQSN